MVDHNLCYITELRGKKKALEIIPSSIANCTLDNKVIRKSGD
jgi:hypothetical protein